MPLLGPFGVREELGECAPSLCHAYSYAVCATGWVTPRSGDVRSE